MISVSASVSFNELPGLRSAKRSKAALADTSSFAKPDDSMLGTDRGVDPGPMAHCAESVRAEMLDRGTGSAGWVNLTWGYEWTVPASDDHFQVASKDGGESRTCQHPVSRCGWCEAKCHQSRTAMHESPLTSAFHAFGTSGVKLAAACGS